MVRRHLLPLVLFFLILCFVAACKKPKDKPPIARDKMAQVITDLQIAETYSLGLHAKNDSNVQRFSKNTDSLYVFYSSILNHYQISFDDFNQAIGWYKNHPTEMDSLLNTALDCLNKARAHLGVTSKPEDIQLNQLQVDSAHLRQPVLRRRDSLKSYTADSSIHKTTT